MLVLSREEGYAIQVGEELLTVEEINGDEVVLSLESDGQTAKHTLKKNETLELSGDNRVIVVVEIRTFGSGNKKVRLGVEAPMDVPVHRKEVYDAIKRNEGL